MIMIQKTRINRGKEAEDVRKLGCTEPAKFVKYME